MLQDNECHIACDLSLNHGGIVVTTSSSQECYIYRFKPGTPFMYKAELIASKILDKLDLQGKYVTFIYEATVFGNVGRGFSQYLMFLGSFITWVHHRCINKPCPKSLVIKSVMPTTAKKLIAGSGKADKLHVLEVVKDFLPKTCSFIGLAPKVTSWFYVEEYAKFDKDFDLSDAMALNEVYNQSEESFTTELELVYERGESECS